MTSLDKIREAINEVVGQAMRAHADQLRSEVSQRMQVFLEEDAKHLASVEQQLNERTGAAKSLEDQLGHTRNEIAEKQKHITSIEKQLRELEGTSAQAREAAQKTEAELRSRVSEVEKNLHEESERLKKESQELSQLLELSQEEVKQLQTREQEQKKRLQELEKQVQDLRAEMQAALEGSAKAKTEALAAQERELTSRITNLEQQLVQAQKDAEEKLQGKERELLEQVHLLEELLVQGQHAREQQLEAKDREIQATLDAKQGEFEARLKELEAQLAERDSMMQARGGELQSRIVSLEKELSERHAQLEGVRKELADSQSVFEHTQKQVDELSAKVREKDQHFTDQQSQWKRREEELVGKQSELTTQHGQVATQKAELEGMQALWEQRERELSSQIQDFEKRIAEFTTAEQDWHKREQELLGHRDKVLSSSAEASEESNKQLVAALEDQTRLQTQFDGLLEELGRVREELQRTQDAHAARERQLGEEIATLRNELGARESGARTEVAPPKAKPATPVAVEDPHAVSGAVKLIHAARTQSEILKALLEGASQFASRSGVFVVHGSTATGWATRGFGSDSEFRKLSVNCAAGLASRVMQGREHLHGQASEFDAKLVDVFGKSSDGVGYIFPLIVRDRVAAFFFADCGPTGDKQVSVSSIDHAVRSAGEWLDDLGKNKNAVAQPIALAAAAAVVAPAPAPATAKPSAVSHASTAVETPSRVEDLPKESTDVSRQRARRFAKLLVDEIKLYNKDAVDAGRKNNDLYDRLRESIDKSRASYEKRWGKQITDVDYFREELVRNLAENNLAVLGNNFR